MTLHCIELHCIGDSVVEEERKTNIGFYLIFIRFRRELLTDPNEGMTDTEIRLGKQLRKVKVRVTQ